MKARPAAGMGLSVYEAMARVVEIPDRAALLAYLAEHYYFWQPTDDNVTIKHYAHDARIGWDTWLVCVDGHAALFTDGPLEPSATYLADLDPIVGVPGRQCCDYHADGGPLTQGCGSDYPPESEQCPFHSQGLEGRCDYCEDQ